MRRREFVRHTAMASSVLAVNPSFPGSLPAHLRPAPTRLDFNPGWQFLLGDADGAQAVTFDDGAWGEATLPHTARIESLVTGAPGSETFQWQGTCWYRKRFLIGPEHSGRKAFLISTAP